MFFMMVTNPSPEKQAEIDACREWTESLPKEHEGFVLGPEGYEDEYANLILPLTLQDTGKTIETLFAELCAAMDEEGFGD